MTGSRVCPNIPTNMSVSDWRLGKWMKSRVEEGEMTMGMFSVVSDLNGCAKRQRELESPHGFEILV